MPSITYLRPFNISVATVHMSNVFDTKRLAVEVVLSCWYVIADHDFPGFYSLIYGEYGQNHTFQLWLSEVVDCLTIFMGIASLGSGMSNRKVSKIIWSLSFQKQLFDAFRFVVSSYLMNDSPYFVLNEVYV